MHPKSANGTPFQSCHKGSLFFRGEGVTKPCQVNDLTLLNDVSAPRNQRPIRQNPTPFAIAIEA